MAKIEQEAEIVREYGPFPGVSDVAGVSFDGRLVWFAAGETLRSFDPATGEGGRALEVAGDAGTAFDGRHLWQIAEARIQKVDPGTGKVLSTIPAPGGGRDSGLAWAEGTLWVGQYRERKIHQVDPKTGAILRTIESNRFVTGVTWVDGELWHGTLEEIGVRDSPGRSRDRRGAHPADDARGDGGQRPGIRPARSVLRRWRLQRTGPRGATPRQAALTFAGHGPREEENGRPARASGATRPAKCRTAGPRARSVACCHTCDGHTQGRCIAEEGGVPRAAPGGPPRAPGSQKGLRP